MGNLLLVFLFFFIAFHSPSGFGQAVTPLPAILQIYYREPQTLEDIEELVRYRWFEKAWEAIKAYPESDEKVSFLKAESLLGMKKYSEALSLFERLAQNAGSPEMQFQSLLKQARVLSRLKKYDASLAIYGRILNGIHPKRKKERYLWEAFKTTLEAKEYSRGLDYLRDLSSPKVFWWRGWCYFRMKNYARAINNWKLIPEKRSGGHYPQSLYWQARAHELLGENAKAKRLTEELVQKYPATYYGYLAHAEPNFFPELYPRPYLKLVQENAKKRRLDPYFVFSMIRQESYYNEAAVSDAGALGVMQLMPQTALKLAQASRYKNFDLTGLFKPEANVYLGCFYIQFLKDLFSNKPALVLAAYNAGEEAVSRWLAPRRQDPMEIFIEEIPFEETQNYTKKVLTNYWVYHWLYHGTPPPRLF